MREKLKASYIAKLECPKERDQLKVFDTEVTGLAVRVTKLGAKTFIFEKRPRGSKKVKQEKIGSCLDFSIEQAREVAREKSLAYSRVDYIKNLREADQKILFGNAFKEYISVKLAQNKESYREKHIGLFERNILNKFSEYPIQEFKRQDLSSVVLPIQASGRQGTAQDVWKAVSAFLTWCVSVGYLDVNPVLGSTPKFAININDRVLPLEELRLIWKTCENLHPIRCSLIRLLILLPFRKSEFSQNLWNDFDGEKINIPSERTKTSTSISLKLSEFAKLQLPSKRNFDSYMFSIREGKATRLDDKQKKNIMKNTGINQFSWHRFRKTFSTYLHQLGEESDVIEACLNHTQKSKMGVSGAYNFADYSKKMDNLMQKWSDIVEEAVGRD